jgi:osmoprotectant transport system permease protein
MTDQLAECFHDLPTYLGGHMLLSLSALAVGLLISLPLGIATSRRPKLAELTLGAAGVIQTVPSLALLALMVPLLGGLIGFWPAFLALILYSILPVLANTVIGIRGVDPSLIEAARGLGMNDRQMLFRVELPLAAPVIIAGVRTATVLVVGTATLVTPVGGRSLGNYIFGGLESINPVATVFGCVIAAVLAIALDQLIHFMELAARQRRRGLGSAAAAGLLLIAGTGLYDPATRVLAPGSSRVAIGSGPFTEQHILSELMARQLESADFRPDRRKSMSEGIQFMALQHGQVECIVNYSGNIWTLVMKRQEFQDRQTTLAEVSRYLRDRHGVVCLGSLGFENAYAFAMPRRRADELNIRSVADLARHASELAGDDEHLKIGGDNQIFDRPEWRTVKERYGLDEQSLKTVAMDPTLMYGAVSDGQVDAIIAYTSDGRIKAFDLALLADPQRAFPPYDALLLVSAAAAQRPGFVEALRPLVGSIALETMQQANRRVDVDGQRPSSAAAWLAQAIAQRP